MPSIINLNRNYVPQHWGFEDWIDNREQYCMKRMFLLKNKKLDWHQHPVKRETFYIWSGKVHVTFGADQDRDKAVEKIIEAGQSFHIEPGMWHEVLSFEDTWLMVASTTHVGDDVIREPEIQGVLDEPAE